MDTTKSERRSVLLGRLIADDYAQLLGEPDLDSASALRQSPLLGGHDPDIAGAIEAELAAVLEGADLAGAVNGSTPAGRAQFVTERLRKAGAHSQDALWALLGGDDRIPAEDHDWPPRGDKGGRSDGPWRRLAARLGRAGRFGQGRVWLIRQAAAALMNLIVLLILAGAWVTCWLLPAVPVVPQWPALALKLFAVWCLPSWLYVRFLGQRAGALWDEYVLNLHRLGWDEPRFLPRPPRTSIF